MPSQDSLASALLKLGWHPNLIRHILQQLDQNQELNLVMTSIPFDDYEIIAQNQAPLTITIRLRPKSR